MANTPITFTKVTAPVLSDPADGVTAFNSQAATTEANFDLINRWAGDANNVLAARRTANGTELFSPATGFAQTAAQLGQTWARTWMGMAYFHIVLNRSGAQITTTGRGNIGDTICGHLAPTWRPPADQEMLGSIANTHLFQGYIQASTGAMILQGLSFAGATILTNSYIIWQGTFPIWLGGI